MRTLANEYQGLVDRLTGQGVDVEAVNSALQAQPGGAAQYRHGGEGYRGRVAGGQAEVLGD